MLKLLRALFNPQSFLPKEVAYYQQVLDDSSSWLISSQLYFILKKEHRLHLTPLFFQKTLKARSMHHMIISAMIAKEMERLLACFERLGIHVIPFKGPFFAKKYFGSLSARSTSDLDILIRPQQMNAAVEAIHSLGFSSDVKYEPEHFHQVFHKFIPTYHFDLCLELHWHVLRKDTSTLNIDQFWATAVPLAGYRHVMELSDLRMFYLICLHGWNHEFNNWKYFIDIIQMIHHLGRELNYLELFALARRERTYRRIVHSLSLVYKVFPHLHETAPLPLPQSAGKHLWWNERIIGTDRGSEPTWPMFVRRMRQMDDYDTLQQRWTFFKREILPDPVTMSRIMHSTGQQQSRFAQYFWLYVHRFINLFDTQKFTLKKRPPEREK